MTRSLGIKLVATTVANTVIMATIMKASCQRQRLAMKVPRGLPTTEAMLKPV